MRNLLRPVMLIACLVLISLTASAQPPDQVSTWLTGVNDARLGEGLAPCQLTDNLLTSAAQRHADDLAASMSSSHTGSDGSTPEQRIAQAGYAAWTLDGGRPVVGESVWLGTGTVDDALAFFLADPPSRENLLSTVYREVGIGVAADGAGRIYCVLDFGARPNVLPIFVNDGAINSEVPEVAIRLTNEEARPGGQGSSMGRAVEMRLGNDPNWDALTWQPWEPLVPWTLPDAPGNQTVYVQFRDAAGRTAASADDIYLGEDVPAPTVPASPTPGSGGTLGPEATPAPSDATARQQTPTASRVPTLVPITVTPFPTWTPLPTPTVAHDEPPGPDPPLGLVAALQGLALILGLYIALRRGRQPHDAGAADGSQDR